MIRFGLMRFSPIAIALALVATIPTRGVAQAPSVEIRVPWDIGSVLADPSLNRVYLINQTDSDLVVIDTDPTVDPASPTSVVAAVKRFEYQLAASTLFIPSASSDLFVFIPLARKLFRLDRHTLDEISVTDLESFHFQEFVIGRDGFLYGAYNEGIVKIDLDTGAVAGLETSRTFSGNFRHRPTADRNGFYVLASGRIYEYEIRPGLMPAFVTEHVLGIGANDFVVSASGDKIHLSNSATPNTFRVWDTVSQTANDFPLAPSSMTGITALAKRPDDTHVWAADSQIVKIAPGPSNSVVEVIPGPAVRYGTLESRKLAITPNERLIYGVKTHSTNVNYLGLARFPATPHGFTAEYTPPWTRPPAPSGISKSIYENFISFNGPSQPRASSIRIYRSSTNDFSTAVEISRGGSVYYSDYAVPQRGVDYFYWFVAENSDGLSPASLPLSGRMPAAPVVTNVSATDATASQPVRISWDDDLYQVWYSIFRSPTSNPADAQLISSSARSTFEDQATEPGGLYYYWIRGRNNVGEGPMTGPLLARHPRILPSVPLDLSASDGDSVSQVTVTWTQADDTARYRVYRSPNPNQQEAVLLGETSGTVFQDYGVPTDEVHYYWVIPVNASGFGPSSQVDAGHRITLSAPTESPVSITASAGDYDNRVFVNVQVSDLGDNRIEIFRNSVDDFGTANLIATLNRTNLIGRAGHGDYDVEANASYFYWARLANVAGNGPETDSVEGWIAIIPSPESAPGGVEATDGTDDEYVSISWLSTENATEYQVFRSETEDFTDSELIGNTSSRRFRDEGAKPLTTYHYWIKARNPSGESGVSLPDSGFRRLPFPGNVHATERMFPDQIRITWNSVSNATNYRIFRESSPFVLPTNEIGNVPAGQTHFFDEAVEDTFNHYYFVQAEIANLGVSWAGWGAAGSIALPDASLYHLPVKDPTAAIFDDFRNRIYVSNEAGVVEIFDSSTLQPVDFWNSDGTLGAAKISPDFNALFLSQHRSLSKGTALVQKLNLTTFSTTPYEFPITEGETVAKDLAILSDDTLLVVVDHESNDPTTIRRIDLPTGTVGTLNDEFNRPFVPDLEDTYHSFFAADLTGENVFINSAGSNLRPLSFYSTSENSIRRLTATHPVFVGAMEPSGRLIAGNGSNNQTHIFNIEGRLQKTIQARHFGMAFDPTRSLLLGVTEDDTIAAYETSYWERIAELPIGNQVFGFYHKFGPGDLSLNSNASMAAVITDDGVQIVPLDSLPHALQAPNQFSATSNLQSAIELTWSAVNGADGYEVYRSRFQAPESAKILASGITTTFFRDLSAKPETSYHYWIRSKSNSVRSPYSSAAVGAAMPGPRFVSLASDLEIKFGTTGTFMVDGLANEGSLRYEWYQGLSGDTSISVGTGTSSLPIEGLEVNSSFWVRLIDDSGAIDSPTFTVRSIPRAVPRIVASRGLLPEFTRISWPPLPEATSYRVYRGDMGIFTDAAFIGEVTSNYFFDDFTPRSGGDSAYFVTAVDADGDEGPFSPALDHLNLGYRGGSRSLSYGIQRLRSWSDFTFSPEGHHLVTVGETGLIDWIDFDSGEVVSTVFTESSLTSIDFSEDGSYLLAGTSTLSPDNETPLVSVDSTTSEMVSFEFSGVSEEIIGVADVTALSGDRAVIIPIIEGADTVPLILLDTKTGLSRQIASVSSEAMISRSHDGQKILVLEPLGESSGQWRVFDTATELLGTPHAIAQVPLSGSLSRTGSHVAISHSDPVEGFRISTFLTNGTPIDTTSSPHYGELFSPVHDELYLVNPIQGEMKAVLNDLSALVFSQALPRSPIPSTSALLFDTDPTGTRMAIESRDGISVFPIIAQPPPGPPLITVLDHEESEIRLFWDRVVENDISYAVWRSESSDPSTAIRLAEEIFENRYTDVTPDPGKVYYYWISATNFRGEGELGPGMTGTTVLPQTIYVLASDGLYSDRVQLTWPEVHPSVQYEIFRSETNQSNDAISLGVVSGTTFSDTTADPFKVYRYWIRTRQGAAASVQLSASNTGSKRLPPPTGVTATSHLQEHIEVNWSPMPGITQYQVLRASSPSPANAESLGFSSSPSLVDPTATLEVNFYYFVRANVEGRLASLSVGAPGRRPFAAPTGLTATLDRLENIRLQWSPRDGAIRYQVLRSTTADIGNAQVVANPTSTTWLDEGADPGKEYHYWVRAIRPPNLPSNSGDPIRGIRFAGRGQELETPSDSGDEVPSDDIAPSVISRLSFEGLVFSSDDPDSVLGSLRAQMFRNAISIVLNFDGQTYRGRSSLDEDGGVGFSFTSPEDHNIILSLQTSASRDHTEALRLTGELNENGIQTGEVFAISNQFHPRLNPAPFAGTYSLAIPHGTSADPQSAPAGDGVAYGSISPNGRFLFRAILADTTRCVLRGLASDDGRLAFYQPLYRGPVRGHLAGVLRVRSIDNISDLDGRVHWRRPPGNSTPSIHEAGFDLALTTIGSKFNAPWRDQRVLSQFADSQSNGLWGFHGGNLTPIPSHRFVTWDARNRVTPVGLSPNERLFINVNRSTGLVSGRYLNTDAANKQTVPFVGIALQKQGLITGHFPGDNEVGHFTIEPAALPELTVRDFSGTEIVSGDSIDFGDTGVTGSTSERLLIIQNTGAGQLLIDEAPSLSNALAFHLVQERAGVLAPGESMAIRVGFRPSIEGNSTSTLVIPSNDAEVNPYRLTLTGVGVAGEASSSDPELPPAELSLPVLTGVSLDSVSPRLYDQENPPTGRYGGLIHPIGSAASIPIGSGSATLSHHRPTGRGLLTVRIVMENSVGILRTFLEADGHADLDSARWTGPLSRNFAISDTFLGTETDDEQIDMISISLERIGTGSPSATLQLFRQDFHPKNNPVPEEISGKFTVLLPLPDALGKGFPPGDGIATANIAPSGYIRMQILLADGTPVTIAGGLDQTAGFSFYKRTNFDQVSGHFQIRPDAGQAPDFFTNTVSDLDGYLFWSKPASPRSRAYPAGFRLELPAVGSRFEYSRGAPLLAGLSEETEINANLLLDGTRSPLTGEAETIASLPIQWLPTNRIHYQRTASEFLSLRVSPANGRVQGIYRHPVSGENLRLNGVVFQKQGLVGGHSLSADRTETGRIEITKIPAP